MLNKQIIMENPFADYGKIIKGDRFVGRKKEIAAIQNRIFGSSFGNLAIQGLPRIGKSSLAWHAIIERKTELIEKNIIPVEISVGKVNSSREFFIKLIKDLHKIIKKIQALKTADFEELHSRMNNTKKTLDRNDFIEEYLMLLRENNFRVIFILDEFDAVRLYFTVADFQFLRSLAYEIKYEICVVTTSRRTLKEIEPQEGSLSNFYQTFTDLNLGMFNQDDIEEYWNKFFNDRISISEEGKNTIHAFAGNHPFLLDLFNYHLYNNLSDDLLSSIFKTRNEIKLTILKNYKTIIDLLKDENLNTKLLQAVVGPVYDITTNDAEKLERYGLIKKSESTTIDVNQAAHAGYDTFSEDFGNYLNMIRREIPIWHLWSETEIKLRGVVNKWLIEKFGEGWVAKFRKLQKKEEFIAGLESAQNKEKRSFPETYSTNLLDFTYPADLFNRFMRVEWSWFKNIFGKSANDWKFKFDLLAKIRNPLAHNKENILQDFERDDAIGYCKEIIAFINKCEKSA